jgi:hypothetical protein
MAKTREVRQVREDLASIIARHLNISRSTAKSDVIPYLRVIFNSNPEVAAKISIGLNLSEDMIRYLSQSNASKIIEIMNKLKSVRGGTGEVKKTKQSRSEGDVKSVKTKGGALDKFFK